MLNKFNFTERMTFRSVLNAIFVLALLIVASVGLFSDGVSNTYVFYGIFAIALVAVCVDLYVTSWCSSAIKEPLKDASDYTNKVSKAIKNAGMKQESSVNRQKELLNETGKMIDKLSNSSEMTKKVRKRLQRSLLRL